MKKILIALTLFLSFFSGLHAEAYVISPKTKTVLSMAGYGTAGGALLGVASMAFDTNIRSVAVGASLGLYTGLIFGGYVLFTHYLKQKGLFYSTPSYEYALNEFRDDFYHLASQEKASFRPEFFVNFVNYRF